MIVITILLQLKLHVHVHLHACRISGSTIYTMQQNSYHTCSNATYYCICNVHTHVYRVHLQIRQVRESHHIFLKCIFSNPQQLQ